MLKILESRAKSLKKGNFKQARKAEKKLTALKNRNLKQVTTPNAFYVTFKEERVAKKLANIGEVSLFGRKKTKLRQARHPSR